jgi:mannitol/fructose-specific phosphotransferase system IIA component (Ntr-type)
METHELAFYFDENLFIPDMKARNKEESLQELSELIASQRYIRNPGLILDMLHQRETLGSTGIGKGVAIPHGRTVAASDVVIAFGKSEKGIDFNSIDNNPAHLFFMVIAPFHDEKNIYLPILGSLVTFLNQKMNRERISQVTTFDEFISIIRGE